jgi:hypothetical protein
MVGYDATRLAPGVSPAPQPAQASAAPPAREPTAVPSTKQTMMGVAASDFLRGGPPPPSALPAAPPAPAPMDPRKGTMMGVAVPGIAPVAATPLLPRAMAGTMMGVAAPGIAPVHTAQSAATAQPPAPRGQPRKAVEIAPKPAPLVDDEPDLGPAPQRVKRGVPFGVVAGVVGMLVAAVGVAAFFILRSVPLVVQPGLDAQGHERLHLHCETCQDGTVAELEAARAVFQGKEADLQLASPLKVGNNPLTIHIDRPNLGRDESVQVIVPVAFRIRADLSDLSAARPAILVRVEAVSGTEVQIDGKPVPLDASGSGVYSTDISSETEGASDELRLIDRVIPYAVTPKSGVAENGKLTVRVGIVPLRLDAPGLHAFVDGRTFRLAGRTARGGSVTANGTPVHAEPDGTFAQAFDIPSPGDLSVEVRASAPQLAPRTAHLVVRRVDHLADEAKAREKVPEATYDAIAADIPGAVGKGTIVEGDVAEVRTTPAQTVAIVDDARGCARAPCLVRVTYGGDMPFKHGDIVRVYGRVTRAVAYGSSTVPEVEADFIQLGHASR